MYDTYIQQLIKEKEIPAAVLVIQKDGEIVFSKSYGQYTDRCGEVVDATEETMFDVASLTKVMATLPATLLLIEREELELKDKVASFFPSFTNQEVSIQHLLQHTSGLSADLPYKKRNEDRAVFEEVLKAKVARKPGQQVQYSDLGMILLGKIIEKVSGIALDQFSQAYLFDPWGMSDTQFSPSPSLLHRIAATESFQGSYIQGEVHDEKAYQLGGVSGSAGLFSTAKDVGTYADYWLYPEKQSVLSKETMDLVVEDVVENRGLGFEVWSGVGKELACGRRWSKGSFGHTGFTGTSLWMDPKEKLAVVLLTNVVHYGRTHRLPEIRKRIHGMVLEEIVKY